jgi:hypothetical protein
MPPIGEGVRDAWASLYIFFLVGIITTLYKIFGLDFWDAKRDAKTTFYS